MEEKFYAIDKFDELERTLSGIIEAMPIKRRAMNVYLSKGQKQRAKDMYAELEVEKKKLLDVSRELSLLFAECDMQAGYDFANRLFGSVKSFNVMVIIQGENPEYFTSKVVAIRKRRLHSIEVETTNTIYRITYEKRKKAKKAA